MEPMLRLYVLTVRAKWIIIHVKKKYTVNTQAIVGADLVFLDIATRFPGSVHDAEF